MVHINPIGFILLGQLIFLAVIDAFYETVNLRVIYGDEVIELNWQSTEQQLANQNLPIWLAEKNKEPQLKDKLMMQESFVAYRDLEKSSAAIYFTSHNSFYGNIDTRFYIVGLPLSNIKPDIFQRVGDGYIFAREEDEENLHNPPPPMPHQFEFNIPSTSSQHEISTNPSVTQPHQISAPTKAGKSPSTILYPEILVFLPHDVYHDQLDLNTPEQIIALIRLNLIYFNSVDLLFEKLSAATDEISIRLNIAGFVIEIEPGVFPLVHNKDAINGFETTLGFTRYIRQYKKIFVEDSFDFYFVATRYKIHFGETNVVGSMTSSHDKYELRMNKIPYTFLAGTVVHQLDYLGDFVIGAHEIAHLLGVEHDPPQRKVKILMRHYPTVRCSGQIKEAYTHCPDCLEWSENHIKQLKIFVSTNKNHCFLLNYPRSLGTFGIPTLSLYPEDQCMCYGFHKSNLNPLHMLSISPNMCNEPLKCSLKEQDPTPLPLDGTPCHGSIKVCWQKKCMSIMERSDLEQSI